MRFGTELEMFHNDYCDSDDTHTPNDVSGFYRWLKNRWTPANGQELRNRGGYCPSINNRSWELKTDGSAGFELSAPADVGPAGLWRMYLDLKALHKLESRGLAVDSHCGQHVHVDVRALRPRHLRRLAQLWARVEPTLLWSVPESRRTCGYCTPMRSDAKAEAWREPFSVSRWRSYCRSSSRGALNLLPWLTRGTIEIRLPAGTLKPFQACAWALVACALVRRASEGRGDFERPAAGLDGFSAAVSGMADVSESLARLRAYWARSEFDGPGANSGRRLAQALEWHLAGRLAFHLPPEALEAPEPEPAPAAAPAPAPAPVIRASGCAAEPLLIANLPDDLRALVEHRDGAWRLSAAGLAAATPDGSGTPGLLSELRQVLYNLPRETADSGRCGCAQCAQHLLARVTAGAAV